MTSADDGSMADGSMPDGSVEVQRGKRQRERDRGAAARETNDLSYV
jgi:hypothetical protein